MNNGLPEPQQMWREPAGLRGAIEQVLRSLEAMFGDIRLDQLRRRQPKHPAVARYDRLFALSAADLKYELARELEIVSEVGGALADASTWAWQAAPDFWSIIADPAARTFVRRRLTDPQFYPDVASELFWWGWLRNRGTEVALTEEPGSPDLRIKVAGGDVWADIKRIHLKTNPAHVRKVIAKANRQVKSVDANAVGVALIHVDRQGIRASLDDRIPSDVSPYVSEALRELGSNGSKSIAQVVFTWDDYMVLGDVSQPTLYALRRRSLVHRHRHPRRSPAVDDSFWDLGLTLTIWTRGQDTELPTRVPPIHTNGAVVTEMFRVENEFAEGVRPGHALETLADPGGLATFGIGGVKVLLATREIAMGRRPYVLLVLAMKRESQAIEVASAYKLFGDSAQLATLATEPAEAFQKLLHDFGVPIRVGTEVGLFVLRAVITAPASKTAMVQVLHPAPNHLMVNAFVRIREERPEVEVSWAFAIDKGRYRQSLA